MLSTRRPWCARAYTTNIWPKNLPGFREALEAYYVPMLQLGLHILAADLPFSLDVPIDFFDGGLQLPTAPLRLLRYPPQPANAKFNQLGAGAHTDWGWITLLAQDDCGGLEVETAGGESIRAEPIPGHVRGQFGRCRSPDIRTVSTTRTCIAS